MKHVAASWFAVLSTACVLAPKHDLTMPEAVAATGFALACAFCLYRGDE